MTAKTATWLRTLEGLVGIETMDEIMKTYFERWKFKHPNSNDFIRVMEKVGMQFDKYAPYEPGGEDCTWYWCDKELITNNKHLLECYHTGFISSKINHHRYCKGLWII